MQSVVDAVITTGLTVFGAAGVGKCLIDLRRGHQSPEWPLVQAHLLDGWIEERRRGGHTGGMRYEPTVRYQYQFAGQLWTGCSIKFCDFEGGSRDDAARWLDEIKRRTPLLVRVDPYRPKVSVIVPGVDGRVWRNLAGFIGFTALAATIAYHSWR